MDTNKTQLERAFELAESGQYASTTEIRAAMSSEGYATDQVTGSSLMKQLRNLIKANQTEPTQQQSA